jgi:hypothetical protein
MKVVVRNDVRYWVLWTVEVIVNGSRATVVGIVLVKVCVLV